MNVIKLFCCQPETVKELTVDYFSFYGYTQSKRDVNGNLYFAIYDDCERKYTDVLTLSDLTEEKMKELNSFSYVNSSKVIVQFLKLIGFKEVRHCAHYSYDENDINVILYKFLVKENMEKIDKDNLNKFLSLPLVFNNLRRDILKNEVLKELFGDLEVFFRGFLKNKKITNTTDFVSNFYAFFLRNEDNSLAYLMDQEQAKEFFKYTLDQKKKGKMASSYLCIYVNFNNDWLLESINWDDYLGTYALKKTNNNFINKINEIQERKGSTNNDNFVLKKYSFYLSQIFEPAGYKSSYLLAFLFSISDEEMDIISKRIKGSLSKFVATISKEPIGVFATTCERTEFLLKLLLDEIEFITNKKQKEKYIENFLEIERKLKDKFDKEIKLEYNKELKAYIIKKNLSNK